MPHPGLLHPEPLPLWQTLLTRASTGDAQTLKGRSGQSLWGLLVCTRFCLNPASSLSLAGMGFASKHDFAPPTILLHGPSPLPWTWGIFFWWDPTFSFWLMFSSELYFGVLTGEGEHTSFYSTILSLWIKDLLSMAPPIRTRPSFPHSQSLHSGNFHNPFIVVSQRADRLKNTITEN